ncbi:MAG: GNAT family N-acetyltransferase, partial [Reyranella sp.]|nr:GNAT family N-acetyltransferase [Reyranella sp.]
MLEISPLRPDDRAGWQPLAAGYNAFYERTLPDADYDRTWRRLMDGRDLHGLAARLDGRVVGIAHYLFHASVWFDEACYLADLFVDETVRGQGAARALIEAVAAAARAR